jgi:hypothetical protein
MNDTNTNKGIINVGQWNWQLVLAISILFTSLMGFIYKSQEYLKLEMDKKDLFIEKLEEKENTYLILKTRIDANNKLDSLIKR